MSFYTPSKPVLHLPSSPSSHFGTSRPHCYYAHGHAPQSDSFDAKVLLRNRLASGALESLPAGFPFHYAMTGCGSPILAYDSFEFREPLYPGGRRQSTRTPSATISFHNPGEKHRHSHPKYLTWSVSIPTNTPLSWKDTHAPIALVRLDSALLNTTYGRFLRKSPAVILRALSISLELGVPITISLLDKTVVPLMPYAKTRDSWQLGDIVYIGTRPDGRQEVLHVTHN